jgi:hypothetical protein
MENERMEKLFSKIIFLLIALSIAVVAPFPKAYASPTTLTFQPITSTAYLNQSLTIIVKVINVTNLNDWQISLQFNPKIIRCTNITIPTENIFQGYNIFFPTPTINNTIGQIIAFCAKEGLNGVSGSGTLCSITFESKAFGVSTLVFLNPMMLQLDGTYLQDPNYNSIPFEPTVGIVQIITSGFTENTFTINYGSETLKITTLSNSTITNFNFNQTTKMLTYDATGTSNTKGACIITIPKKIMNQTIIVLSDTTPLSTFITELNTLPENGTHNFLYYTYTQSTHKIKIFQTINGDITGDRKTDTKDVATVSRYFGTTSGSPNYKLVADVNQDGKVDVKDVAYISKNFGQIFKL